MEASLAVRPALRAFAARTGAFFEALPGVGLAPWSDAETDRTGAADVDWSEEAELNVEAEWIVFESTGAALLTGEAVEAVP